MFQIAPKYEIQMDVVSPLALIEFLKTFLVKEWAFNVQLLHLLWLQCWFLNISNHRQFDSSSFFIWQQVTIENLIVIQ